MQEQALSHFPWLSFLNNLLLYMYLKRELIPEHAFLFFMFMLFNVHMEGYNGTQHLQAETFSSENEKTRKCSLCMIFYLRLCK